MQPREYPKKFRIGLIYAGGIPKGASPLCVVAGAGFIGEGPHRKGPAPMRPFAYFSGEGKVGRGPGAEPPSGFGKKHVSPHPPGDGRISPASAGCAGPAPSKSGCGAGGPINVFAGIVPHPLPVWQPAAVPFAALPWGKAAKMLLFSSFVLTNKEALYIMLSDFRSDNQIPLSRVAEGTAR